MSVTWRHNQDFAARWFEDDEEPVYYRNFEKSAELNTHTWSLKISNLQKSFSGSYSVEINNKDPTTSVKLVVLDPVSKPNVTHVCDTTSNSCTLTCMAEQGDDAEYVWRDAKGNTQKGHEWTVQRPEQEDTSFTCNISNAVSWETAELVITVEQISADGVDEPTILHSCNSTTCVLSCTALGSQPQFSWTDGNGLRVSGPELVVQRGEQLDKIYTCNATNAVSWKTKSIMEREMFPVLLTVQLQPQLMQKEDDSTRLL
ncbi:SLAM family member 8-like [Engraulis encrasicolus]|uniref:SLAM family member 8-like n=1 Tax=Engraulis encrasicolus TaxID=184585 RepID=UPI002FD0CF28